MTNDPDFSGLTAYAPPISLAQADPADVVIAELRVELEQARAETESKGTAWLASQMELVRAHEALTEARAERDFLSAKSERLQGWLVDIAFDAAETSRSRIAAALALCDEADRRARTLLNAVSLLSSSSVRAALAGDSNE